MSVHPVPTHRQENSCLIALNALAPRRCADLSWFVVRVSVANGWTSPARDFALGSRTIPGMETPTSILVGGGILAVATYGLIFRGLNQAYKRAYKAETGHNRAERREWYWYWNKDRNTNTEKIPVEGPLS
jgi:hypothetical protein